jgi:ubiquinone/menaquinone biosynthesis C-methylase UbiE
MSIGRSYSALLIPMPPLTTDAWSATKYNTTAPFVYSDVYTAPILDLLDAQSGEKIVDFGCGTGELTKSLMNIVGQGGTVLGMDASENMVGIFKL